MERNLQAGGTQQLGQRAISPGPQTDNGTAASPALIAKTLRNAIASSKSWDSKAVFSQPETHQVKEHNTNCDARLADLFH